MKKYLCGIVLVASSVSVSAFDMPFEAMAAAKHPEVKTPSEMQENRVATFFSDLGNSIRGLFDGDEPAQPIATDTTRVIVYGK